MKKTGFLLMFCLISNCIYAQIKLGKKHKKSELSLRLTVSSAIISDRHFSYLNLNGSLSHLALKFQRQTERNNWGVALTLGSGSLETDVFLINPDFTSIELNAYYLRKIPSSPPKFQFFLGGGLRSNNMLIQDEITNVLTSVSITAFHNIELVGKVIFKPHHKHELAFRGNFALVSLISRQPYAGYDEQYDEDLSNLSAFVKGDISGFTDHLFYTQHFSYNYFISNWLLLKANITSQLMSHKSNRNLGFHTTGLTLGLGIKL